MADPNSPPSGRAVGGGGAPDLRRPSQRWKATPPGTPFRHPTASNAGPQGGTLWGRCWVPTPAPTAPGAHGSQNPGFLPQRTGGLGEGQRLTPDAPHNGGRPPPPGTAPPPPPRHAVPTGHAGEGDSVGPRHPHARAHSIWVADPNSPPIGRAVRRGGAPDLRRPSQRRKASPPGMPFPQPLSEQRRPARAHAVGPVLGPHARTDRTRDKRAAEPRLPAPEDGRPGEGQRLTPDSPKQRWRASPPGDGPPPPPRHAAPTGHAGQGDSDGPPHPHARTRSTPVTDRNNPPSGRAVGGGGAPDLRRPS